MYMHMYIHMYVVVVVVAMCRCACSSTVVVWVAGEHDARAPRLVLDSVGTGARGLGSGHPGGRVG
jgi:hypothetical protein